MCACVFGIVVFRYITNEDDSQKSSIGYTTTALIRWHMKLNCISLNGCKGSDLCCVRWIDLTQCKGWSIQQSENILESQKMYRFLGDASAIYVFRKSLHITTYSKYLASIIATVRLCGKTFSYAQRRVGIVERREIFFYILTMEIFLIFFYCYGSDKRKHLYFAIWRRT